MLFVNISTENSECVKVEIRITSSDDNIKLASHLQCFFKLRLRNHHKINKLYIFLIYVHKPQYPVHL